MARRSLVSRRVLSFAFGSSLVLSLAACAALSGIDGYAIGACKGGEPCSPTSEGGSRVDAKTDTGKSEAGGGDVTCPSDKPGPTLVKAGEPGNEFCIDSTEVTVRQYKEFQTSNPSTADQIEECKWNNSWAPADPAPTADNVPQTQIDWCDAYAYCKWAGKRLCGKVVDGEDPQAHLAEGDLASTSTDQWYIACSAAGAKPYGYGTAFKSGACNLLIQSPPAAPVASGTYPKCEGGYDGLFDMIGNVWEWIDMCVVTDAGGPLPENHVCYSRGGSFGSFEKDGKCTFNGTLARRSGKNDQIGFRCCSP